MAHRNSWFTELKDGDFPVRYVKVAHGWTTERVVVTILIV